MKRRIQFIKPSLVLITGMFCCLLFILGSSLIIDLGYFFQPFFYLFFYFYYYTALKRHNIVFALFLITAYIGEVFLIIDVHKYFVEIIVMFILAAAAMLYTFLPILKLKSRKISKEMLVEPGIGLIFCVYTVIYLMTMYYELVPNKFLFISGAILLLFFTMVCFLIPLRNRHPSNVYLYLIGGGLLVEAILAFVYTYSLSIPIIAVGTKIAICVHKTCVTLYFVSIDDVYSDESREGY